MGVQLQCLNDNNTHDTHQHPTLPMPMPATTTTAYQPSTHLHRCELLLTGGIMGANSYINTAGGGDGQQTTNGGEQQVTPVGNTMVDDSG
jgi:hypothetical protein